jgi:hypothetical protein
MIYLVLSSSGTILARACRSQCLLDQEELPGNKILVLVDLLNRYFELGELYREIVDGHDHANDTRKSEHIYWTRMRKLSPLFLVQ